MNLYALLEKGFPVILLHTHSCDESKIHNVYKEIKSRGAKVIYITYENNTEFVEDEDLIISKTMRGHGIGSALLDQVILYGAELGVKRICWEVIDWNTTAVDFYERKGARVMRDWNVVQLDDKGIKNYISKIN